MVKDRQFIELGFREYMDLTEGDHMILRIDAMHFFMKKVKKFGRYTRDMLMRSKYFMSFWIYTCVTVEGMMLEAMLGSDIVEYTEEDFIMEVNAYVQLQHLQGEVESVLQSSVLQVKTNKNKAPKVKYSWQKKR